MVSPIRLASLAAVVLLACPVTAHAAAKAPPVAYDQSDNAPDVRDIVAGQHIEGHIAYMHAELGITPDQEAQWAGVAEAMRTDVKEMYDAERRVARQEHGRETAMQYLQNRTMFAELRAQGEQRFLTAMQPLYESLSSRQKQAADDLLTTASPSDQ